MLKSKNELTFTPSLLLVFIISYMHLIIILLSFLLLFPSSPTQPLLPKHRPTFVSWSMAHCV